MAVHMLPLRPDLPHYLFQVELEGRTYTLELRWNERAAGWFLSVLTADEVPILQGRRVVVGFPLLARFRDFRLPPGELEAIDTTGAGRDPGLTELGARVQLMYTDSTSLPAEYTTP